MAEAAGHKWGQFVGEYCESALEPLLQDFADKHGLFLDKKGPRPARSGKKLRWVDSYGNGHDLDYVLERGGTPEKSGTPVAFIESAWRRYTKHSKNKAQEIQGAVLPIAEKHRYSAPLLGCILAGDYTANSLNQLRSIGFKVLYLSVRVRSRDVSPSWAGCAGELLDVVVLLVRARRSPFQCAGRCDLRALRSDPKSLRSCGPPHERASPLPSTLVACRDHIDSRLEPPRGKRDRPEQGGYFALQETGNCRKLPGIYGFMGPSGRNMGSIRFVSRKPACHCGYSTICLMNGVQPHRPLRSPP
jgi:hypothetical protein